MRDREREWETAEEILAERICCAICSVRARESLNRGKLAESPPRPAVCYVQRVENSFLFFLRFTPFYPRSARLRLD